MRNVIAVVLAGGRGERLMPLTNGRAKPAVPFAGKWTIFDFVMNSIINSEISKTMVLTQYGAQALIDHIEGFSFSNPLYGQSVKCVPAQMRIGSEWYKGTADAVFQNLGLISSNKEINIVAILAGDHVIKIDIRQVCEFHNKNKSMFTVCCLAMPSSEAAGNFGVVEVDENNRIIGFEEKPENPKEIPDRPGFSFVSIGNYVSDLQYLSNVLEDDAHSNVSSHDFGNDVIPKIIRTNDFIFAYDFGKNNIPGERHIYWRDVGRISTYHEVHMDLVSPEPELSLYNKEWPLRTFPDGLPPAKFVNPGQYEQLITSGGCIIDGACIEKSVLNREVRVEFGSQIYESILLDSVHISAWSKIERAIIGQGVYVPEGVCVGCNAEEDERRGLKVVDGITIVPEGFLFK